MDEGLKAIVGGTLIDGTGKTSVKKSVVVIRGSKVVEVGIEGEVNIPNEAEISVEAGSARINQGAISRKNTLRAFSHEDSIECTSSNYLHKLLP